MIILVLRNVQKFLVILLILSFCSLSFPISQIAIEYYSAGELSYKSGDYVSALRNYEMAISNDPTIEGYDPYIKFKMGISAYMIGNYDKAKSYLSGYNSNFVEELLQSINKRQAQDEWKRWILKNRPLSSEVSTTVTNYNLPQGQSSAKTYLIVIIVFITIFSILIFTELRILKLKRAIIELPKPVPGENLSNGSKGIEMPIEKTKEETKEDEVLKLIPEDAKIIDFEKLINSEIDIFKDLLEENVTNKGNKVEPEERVETEEEKTAVELIFEEQENLEDMLQESKDIINELVEEHETKIESNPINFTNELSVIETELIEKLHKYSETNPSESNLSVEIFEELQRDFSYFDDIDKITQEVTEVLVEKLIIMSRGENS
ncbi:MAG: tetratricopeptide repeat protein [Fervidobacterium nodosum]